MKDESIRLILGEQSVKVDEWDCVYELFAGHNLIILLNSIYNWGVIQGKRRERAKRKAP